MTIPATIHIMSKFNQVDLNLQNALVQLSLLELSTIDFEDNKMRI